MALSTNHRAIRWLRAQLPELVAGGVISPENAAAIDRHYAAAEARSPNFGFVILAGIGSALVGAGVILLIAHIWDEMSRPVRCLLAFLPLVSALALVVSLGLAQLMYQFVERPCARLRHRLQSAVRTP